MVHPGRSDGRNILFTSFFPSICYDSTWLEAEKVFLTLIETVNFGRTQSTAYTCLNYQLTSWQALGRTVGEIPLIPWPCSENLNKHLLLNCRSSPVSQMSWFARRGHPFTQHTFTRTYSLSRARPTKGWRYTTNRKDKNPALGDGKLRGVE